MQKIRLRDHGVLPGQDVTLALKALFEAHPQDAVFVFEPGDYFFHPGHLAQGHEKHRP